VFIAGEGRFTWDLSSKFLRNFSENCVEWSPLQGNLKPFDLEMSHYQDNFKIPFFMSLKCYPLSLWIWSSSSSPQELSNDTWFN
jgi:hypothetical protein